MTTAETGLSKQEFLAARVWYVDDYLVRPNCVSWVELRSGEKVVLVGRSDREQHEFFKSQLMEASE